MWVRIAAHYPVWYEIEPLARYHRRPRSLISGSARSGAAIRDYRLTIDLVTEYIEPGRRASAHRAQREGAAPNGRSCRRARSQPPVTGRRRSSSSERPCSPTTLHASPCGRRRPPGGWSSPGENGQTVSDRRPELPRRFAPPADAKDRPLSVMIPTYNCAGYLRETPASVLAQDPGPDQMQIEVVDDCSTDDPQAIVDELARTRVSFHQQPENRGHTHNFNTCIERSRQPLRPPPRRRHRPRRLLPNPRPTLPPRPRPRRRLLPLHLDERRRRLGDDRRSRAGWPRDPEWLARADRTRPATAAANDRRAPLGVRGDRRLRSSSGPYGRRLGTVVRIAAHYPSLVQARAARALPSARFVDHQRPLGRAVSATSAR